MATANLSNSAPHGDAGSHFVPRRWPTAAISGATGGLGASFARQLAAKGYHLLLTDISSERLTLLAEQLRVEYPIEVECIAADLCDAADVQQLSDRLAIEYDLELLVNCAGFGGSNRFATSDPRRLLAMMDVHVSASIALTRAALPGMIERDCGYIINVASIMGFVRTGPVSYGSTKRFLIDFSERLQLELSNTSLRIQALCPGIMRTAFFDDPYFKNMQVAEMFPPSLWLDVNFVVATSLKALRGKRVVCIPGRFYQWFCALVNNPTQLWMTGYGRRRHRGQPQPVPYGLLDRDTVPDSALSNKDSTTMKSVVVTGVSSGIGRSAAQQLVRNGFHVFGTVRKLEDARELQAELGECFTPLVCDVCNVAAVQEAAKQVETQLAGKLLWGLVNNAGIALIGPLMHLPIEQVRNQMDVNVTGLIGVTQAFLPLLGGRRNLPPESEPGRIVNVSSIVGILPMPMFGAYSASKHAVEALSRSLRTEVAWYKIPVILIEPGPIESPIWSKMINVDLYKGTDYEKICEFTEAKLKRTNESDALPVVKASQAICRALMDRRPKSRYIVNRYPIGRSILAKFIPQSWIDRLLTKQFCKEGAKPAEPV